MDRRLETSPLRAYLLRFWKVSSADPLHAPTWRFSLEDCFRYHQRGQMQPLLPSAVQRHVYVSTPGQR